MQKKAVFLIVYSFISSLSIGQNDQSVKITVFKPSEEKTTVATKIMQDQNCIKWNYSLLARGVFLLNYEHPISKKVSAEVGLGVTYRDLIFETYSGLPFNDFGSNNKNFGFAVEGGVRLYPKDFDNFEGFFISPIVSYRTYSTPQPTANSSSSSTTTAVPNSNFKPGYNLMDLQFKIGYAYESFWDWDIIGEVYAGFAMRYADVKYYDLDNNTSVSQYTPKEESIKLPQFLFGLKVGLPF